MEIEIKNFGPISYLKFDIDKDLHLIYGKNAIGKSYATYCIYCLLKNLSKKNSFSLSYFYKTMEIEEFVKAKIHKLYKNQKVDITEDCRLIINEVVFEMLLNEIKQSFSNTFSTLKNLHNKNSDSLFHISICSNNTEIYIYQDIENDNSIKIDYVGNHGELKFVRKDTKTTKYSLYINDKKKFATSNEKEFYIAFEDFILKELENLLDELDFGLGDIYFLPASRSGLYQALNSFTPILAELTQNRFFLKNKSIELPSLSEPLADYFLDLSTLDKNRNNKKFEEVIHLLEQGILQGKIEYDDTNKHIIYKPNKLDIELNLSEASSMVSELAPLVIYLKHIVNHKYNSRLTKHYKFRDRSPKNLKDIIFIEEPEAHLHPEIQVKLMELFVKLTKLNLKIFITSHSNYMFNKLNNLIISGEMDYKNVMVYHLVHTDKGSVNDFEMTPTKEGMNDENFQDVSEQLYYERMKFLEEND